MAQIQPNGVDHAMKANPGPIGGKGKVGEPSKPLNKTGIIVYAAIFFDGTKNNRYNSALYRVRTAKAQQMVKDLGTPVSYTNYFSNVSIAEETNKKRRVAKHEISVYIEGEGTNYELNYQTNTATYYKDDTRGYAFGSGPTGIYDKVTKGINFLRDKVLAPRFYDPKTEYIQEIKVDAFGFSRGAAAARHFISRRDRLQAWPGQPQQATVTIKFVGLFDTVSSYDNNGSTLAGLAWNHVGKDGTKEFSNDVEELGLAIQGNAKRVVHFVAGNEYRENFASTNIKSSLGAGIGYEVLLPGAHSDIGGGYQEEENEEHPFADKAEADRLLKEGWFTPSQLQYPWYSSSNPKSGKRKVEHQYQFIPLALMLLLANKSGLEMELAVVDEGTAQFTEPPYQQYNVSGILAQLTSELRTQVLSAYQPPKSLDIVLNEASPTAHQLRNQFLHLSVSDDTGMAARLGSDGVPLREHHDG